MFGWITSMRTMTMTWNTCMDMNTIMGDIIMKNMTAMSIITKGMGMMPITIIKNTVITNTITITNTVITNTITTDTIITMSTGECRRSRL